MDQFDNIPIKDLNKVDGYQLKQIDDNTAETEVDDESKPLLERIENPKWKIRMGAYKEISELFYNEYSKQC